MVDSLIVVAHPDDETLWAGGFILDNPNWNWFVASLCRGKDPDRAPRFFEALHILGSNGAIADLDDGPDQIPISADLIEETVISLLPKPAFDFILTHGPQGEYTYHRRHEETSRAVSSLLSTGKITSNFFWNFSYEDEKGRYLPKPARHSNILNHLSSETWERKLFIIAKVYGFDPATWEYLVTPKIEAFSYGKM